MPSPVPKDYSKARWIHDLLITISWTYLLTDLVTALLVRYSTDTPFFAQPLSLQIFFAFLHAIRFVTGVEWTYDILAIFCVSIGLSTPSDWPPTFGSFTQNCYTISGLWGRFYHQWLRRNVLTAGVLFNKLFGIRKGSIASRYTQLFVGFGFSALIHMFGAIAGRYEDHGFWQSIFFLVQPVGIVVEESVVGIARSVGLEKNGEWFCLHRIPQHIAKSTYPGFTKSIGFLWVTVWMLYTLRWMVAFMPVQWIKEDRPPSITDLLFGLFEHK